MTQVSTRRSWVSPLEDQILNAFKQALSEEQSEVAEYLLRALEVLQPNPAPASSVAKAYRAIDDIPSDSTHRDALERHGAEVPGMAEKVRE